MTNEIVLCTDGSPHAIEALAAGISILAPGDGKVMVTVIAEPDPTLVTGTGVAGGTLTPEDFEHLEATAREEAEVALTETARELGLGGTPTKLLMGSAGKAICEFADKSSAKAIVIGTRGRSGFKRAVLGSVSDYVVRHAPCPVVVTAERG